MAQDRRSDPRKPRQLPSKHQRLRSLGPGSFRLTQGWTVSPNLTGACGRSQADRYRSTSSSARRRSTSLHVRSLRRRQGVRTPGSHLGPERGSGRRTPPSDRPRRSPPGHLHLHAAQGGDLRSVMGHRTSKQLNHDAGELIRAVAMGRGVVLGPAAVLGQELPRFVHPAIPHSWPDG